MRRKDREMDSCFALSIADKCEYAVISMIDLSNKPYCIPVSPVRIGEYLYFHCAMDGKKVDILEVNPNVCVCCVGNTHPMENEFTTEYESAIIVGKAEEVTGDHEKVQALRAICEHHTPMNMGKFDAEIGRSLIHTAVWRIHIDEITGKRKKYDKEGKEMKFGRME
jgi:nitroimidazol reductase NimA-like FMN-containing flavoprotein (pyridoxamine 5'-phosphate oxidase superfamily)